MIQAPRKSNGIELSYEQGGTLEASGVRAISLPPELQEGSAVAEEIERLNRRLREVREWADRGEWRESGSDGLYAILSEVKR